MGTCVDIHAADLIGSPRHGGQPMNHHDAFGLERIHALIENQAERSPNSTAVVFEDRQLTYGELNARANQLAHFLRNRSVTSDTLVALRMERSLELIVGILGILKAGGAYLPIDPAYPAERQQAILRDARVGLLLTQSHLPPIEFAGEVQLLDSEWGQLSDEPCHNAASLTESRHLAYAMYTSGSSGHPKGVLVTHANLLHSTLARFRYYSDRIDRFLLLSSHSFDSSVAGIFWTLSQGGTLVLPHEYSRQTAFELADLIARHRVSHILCLPSLYAVLLDQSGSLGSLRCVIVAGESCPPGLVQRHHLLLPGAKLFNEYGPTEGTVWSTVYHCVPGAGLRTVPIGRPIPGTQVHILDAQLRPVPVGATGELHIGGPGVARGYLDRPELNTAKFVLDPFDRDRNARLYRTGDLGRFLPDGNIEFLGRADNQIKIRGHRIELEEIEAVLKRNPSVETAVVVVHEKPRPVPVNGEAEQLILRRLSQLPPAEAERILAEVEASGGSALQHEPNGESENIRDRHVRQYPEFDVTLEIRKSDFIPPPRTTQRAWLLNRALDEFEHDLQALDSLARRFVPGAPGELQVFTADRTQADLSEQEILEDWHIPLMKAMARGVTATHGDILEVGFGRGLAAGFLQECGVRSHTIIECNESVIRRFYEPWRARHADRDIRLVRGRWQDVIEGLGEFGGIFFQTYPLNEREFAEHLSRSVVFAEHFFPIAASHLKPGGAFTYLTHEIDSLSRRHQRLVFQHFRSLNTSVERLTLPADCRDLWWSDSMVVAVATK